MCIVLVIFVFCCSCLVCIVVVVLFVFLSSYVYLLHYVCIAVFTLDAGLLARFSIRKVLRPATSTQVFLVVCTVRLSRPPPTYNLGAETICCNLISSASDDGFMLAKHVELRKLQ